MPNKFGAVVGRRFAFTTKPRGGWDGVVHGGAPEAAENRRLVGNWIWRRGRRRRLSRAGQLRCVDAAPDRCGNAAQHGARGVQVAGKPERLRCDAPGLGAGDGAGGRGGGARVGGYREADVIANGTDGLSPPARGVVRARGQQDAPQRTQQPPKTAIRAAIRPKMSCLIAVCTLNADIHWLSARAQAVGGGQISGRPAGVPTA